MMMLKIYEDGVGPGAALYAYYVLTAARMEMQIRYPS
jgi:hypothetical protein